MPMFSSNPLSGITKSLPFRRKSKMYVVNEPEPSYNVIYLGNVLTVMAKGDGCTDKALALIWKTYETKTRPDMPMELSVTRQGLKAETKQQGLTEYWAHRTTYCVAPTEYPKVFCWIYKHEGKRMKPELRCHAVLCKRATDPSLIAIKLVEHLQAALAEYKREKVAKQNTRLSGLITGYSSLPRRKHSLITGSKHFRPPVNRSKSAPKLGNIEEDEEDDEEDEDEDEYDDSLDSQSDRHQTSEDGQNSELDLEVLLVPGTPRTSTSSRDSHPSYTIEEDEDDSLQPSPSSMSNQSSPNDTNDFSTLNHQHPTSAADTRKSYVVDLEIGNDLDQLRLADPDFNGGNLSDVDSMKGPESVDGASSTTSGLTDTGRTTLSSSRRDHDTGSADSTTSEESGYHEKSSLEDEHYEIEFSHSLQVVADFPSPNVSCFSTSLDGVDAGGNEEDEKSSTDTLTTLKGGRHTRHGSETSSISTSCVRLSGDPDDCGRVESFTGSTGTLKEAANCNTVEIVVSF